MVSERKIEQESKKLREQIKKEKKLVNNGIFICIKCGSDKISHNDYTLYCNECKSLHFYEVAAIG